MLQSVYPQHPMREDLTWLLGEEWYTAHRTRLWDAKKSIPLKHFWWFKGDLKSQWIQKFCLCDESNPINPRCGKISANFCISPPHPPHPQFYPQQWWKFRYTSWLTTTQINSRHSGTVQWKWRTFVCITKTLAQKVWCTIASNYSWCIKHIR